MPSASTTEVFNCTAEELYNIITDYEKYPEFLGMVKGMKVLKTEKSKKLVEYSVSVMKDFKYKTWMEEKPHKSVTWNFAEGDLFKKMSGSWTLEPQGNKVKATYHVESEFAILVPGFVAKTLMSVDLPNMINAYKKRIEKLYGKR
jgi:ribosome-associated toxin RatA of RatAB toxin-antitoxin module